MTSTKTSLAILPIHQILDSMQLQAIDPTARTISDMSIDQINTIYM